VRKIPWLILVVACASIFIGFGWFQWIATTDGVRTNQAQEKVWLDGDQACMKSSTCDLYKWEKLNPEPTTQLQISLWGADIISQTILLIILFFPVAWTCPPEWEFIFFESGEL